MSDSARKLAAQLESNGAKTARFFRSLSPSDWNRKVYSDGAHWQVQEILGHIAQAEDSVLRLVNHILKGGAGTPEDFDLDAYNDRKVSEVRASTPQEMVELFCERRANTVARVGELSSEQLSLEGRHPFLGQAKVADMLKLMYLHVDLHLRDVRKKIKETHS